MDYRQLGRTDLHVSAIALGTMTWGEQNSEAEAFAQIERAKAGVDQAKTASMPTVYLQAEQDYDQPSYRDDTRVSVVFEGTLEGMGFATRGRTGAANGGQRNRASECAAPVHSNLQCQRTQSIQKPAGRCRASRSEGIG